MKVEVIEDVLRAESSGKEIAKKHRICDSTVSSIKHNLSQLKYKTLLIEGHLVCTVCKKRSKSLSFHHVHATGEVIALVCTSCNRKMKQINSIPDTKLEMNMNRGNGEYVNVGNTYPIISFDLQQRYYDAIRRGIDEGEWRTLSEAVRTLIKDGLKKNKYSYLLEEENNPVVKEEDKKDTRNLTDNDE